MRQIQYKSLDPVSFKKFGSFSDMLNPTAEKLGPGMIEFYRDMEQVAFPAGAQPSLSANKAQRRPWIIEKCEYHNFAGEGLIPLDGDILIHLAPASRGPRVPFDRIEVFRIPKGTFVSLRPGVWHHAPFPFLDATVHTLVLLPERTYENDCQVVLFSDDEKIEIVE